MVETDAPYLTPMPHRGKPNEPAYLRRHTRAGEFLKEFEIANGVADMDHGAGAMWLAVEDVSAVRRYGADGHGRFWAQLPSPGTDLTFGRGSLWALSEANTLTRIDARNARERKTEMVPGRPQEVAISGRLAMVTVPTANRVFVFDTRTLDRKDPPVKVADYPYGIASRGRDVYVTAQDADALVHLKR